jgi:hypothetical protein
VSPGFFCLLLVHLLCSIFMEPVWLYGWAVFY